jgi:hypothetical protein
VNRLSSVNIETRPVGWTIRDSNPGKDNHFSVDICALLGYYAAHSDNSVPTVWDNLLFPYSRVKKSNFLILEDKTVRLSRNVGTELPLYAA